MAAHNLGRILYKLFGIGKPKALQGAGGLAALAYFIMLVVARFITRIPTRRAHEHSALVALPA